MKKRFVILGVFILILTGCNIQLTSKINHSQEKKKEIIALMKLSDQELTTELTYSLLVRNSQNESISQYYYSYQNTYYDWNKKGYLKGDYNENIPPFLIFYRENGEVYREYISVLDEPQKIYIESFDSEEKFKEGYLRNNFSRYNIDLSDFKYYSIDYSGQHPLNSYTEHIFTTDEKVKYDINFFDEHLELMIEKVIISRNNSSLGTFTFYGTFNGYSCVLKYSKQKDW